MNKDGFLNTNEHHRTFWKWSGGFTALILVITLGVICQSRIISSAMKRKAAGLRRPRRPSESKRHSSQTQPPAQGPTGTAGLSMQGPAFPESTAEPPTQRPTSSPPVSPTGLVPVARGGPSSRNSRRLSWLPPTPQSTPPPNLPGQNTEYYYGRQPQPNGQDNYDV